MPKSVIKRDQSREAAESSCDEGEAKACMVWGEIGRKVTGDMVRVLMAGEEVCAEVSAGEQG